MNIDYLDSWRSPDDPAEIDDLAGGSWLVQTATENWLVDLRFRRLIWIRLAPLDEGSGTPEAPFHFLAGSTFHLVELLQCRIGAEFLADVSFLHLERHRIHLEMPVLAIIGMYRQ